MKCIKIITVALILALIATSLSSCMVLNHRFDYIDKTNVTSIEIYDLRGDYHHDVGFYELMDPIYTLSAEQYADFLDTLTKLKFTSTLILIAANDPTLHYSNTMTVKINHSNGVFETVSPYGYAEQYDPNEDSLDAWDYGSCDYSDWELLLQSVVPQEIYNSEPKDPYGTFSYNEALSSATASGSNIRTSGFVNSTGLDYSRYSGEPLSWYSVEAILMRAKDECTIEYEHTRLYIDKEEYVYCIEFMGKSEKECIYINRSLATILAVKIPTTDAGTENGVN
ncbi:MAG: hypothetical protein E7670_02760 [Ruminococcaceae bacterium]|nr:hypothetical protein [Oscillospiraceae bacterium]